MIITSAFPPTLSPGAHRVLGLCRHLVGRGWNVTVIALRSAEASVIGESLLASVPREVRAVWVPAPDLQQLGGRVLRRLGLRKGFNGTESQPTPESACEGPRERQRKWSVRRAADWFLGWLVTPDDRIAGLVPAFLAGIRECVRHRPQVIFSSAPCWTGHVVAAALSKFMGIPFVADFRDPWCGEPYRRYSYESHHYAAKALERWVVRSASRITSAVGCITRHLVARYRKRHGDIETILNGFDADQVRGVLPKRLYDGQCVLMHAGTLYGPRSPVPLLAGLKYLRDSCTAEAGKVRIALLGSPMYNGRPVLDIAREYGVESQVTVMPPVPHTEALGYVKGADVALLFGQAFGPGFDPVPAKVYEYIGLQKPVLAIEGGEEALLVLRQGGCRFWNVSGNSAQEMAAVLCSIVEEHTRTGLKTPVEGMAAPQLTRTRMAQRLEAVLREASRGRCRSPVGACTDSD